MQASDNISILCSDPVIDLISNSQLSIDGSSIISRVNSEIGSGIVVKSNQYFIFDKQDVFAKMQNKGTISFWLKFPEISSNNSIPIFGIGSNSVVLGSAMPSSGMIYFYLSSDDGENVNFNIVMHASANDMRIFRYGPIEPFELKNFIFTYDLGAGVIILYVDGAVADLSPYSLNGSSTAVPPLLWHNSNNTHRIIFNKFSAESISGLRSGGYEISDVMLFSDHIYSISDISVVINNGGLNFILRKSGAQQGSLPSMSLPAVASSFSRGRINDTVSTPFGILAGTEDGNILLGVEKFWQRKISFGNPEEVKKIVFSKTSSNFIADINSSGYLTVRGANFRIF